MSIQFHDDGASGRTGRGRWAILALIVAYILLAVAIGAARAAALP